MAGAATNGVALSPDRRALLELLIRGRPGPRAVAAPTATAEDRVVAASHAQRRLWFLDQLQDEQAPYTLHSVQELDRPIEPEVLRRALDRIVARHEVLRTTFAVQEDGQPWQQVAAHGEIPFEVTDLGGLPEAERSSEAARMIGAVISRRMDLGRGPLLTASLYRLAADRWLFLLAAHHIVFDGPSFALFFDELRAAYAALLEGREPGLPPLPAQYAELAGRREAALTPERIETEVGFWRDELAGVEVLELPLDRRRPATPSFRGAAHHFAVPPDLTAGLRALGAGLHATLFMVLLGGLAATLSRLCGQEDIAVGLPVAGRDQPDMDGAIGFFVDTVVVRCRVDEDPTAEELVARTRAAVSRSLAHRALPFDLLVEHLRPVRELGVNPFFQVGFQLVEQGGDGDAAAMLDVPRTGAMFDLGLDTWSEGEGLHCRLEYNTDLFDAGTAEDVAVAFLAALRSMLDPRRRVSELAVWDRDRPEQWAVLKGATVPLEHATFPALLREVARRHPDATALDGPGVRLSYAALEDRVAALSGQLAARGVAPGAYVALQLPRSIELACLQLAVWRCGAAFVAIDPRWPEDRRERVLADVRPALVVTPDVAAELWAASAGRDAGAPEPAGSDAAYLIFTSGSTGSPKGVVLEHAGLLNVAVAQGRIFDLEPGRRVAQLAAPTFDASVFELVLALGTGATLVVPPPEALAGDELAAFLRDRDVDTVVLPPSLLATVAPVDAPGLRLICVAGESCPVDLAERWQRGREFWNLYGPTEATIWATYGRGVAGARVPIGSPVPNVSTRVVDRNGRPVAVGVAGELAVGGIGVARGYLGDPTLTTRRFVPDPDDPGGRLYRTGDLVRQLRDGGLVFLGRVDRQVKVRGFRIEPEEVETVLRRHAAVRDAVVEARDLEGGSRVLVAYLQGDPGDVDAEDCRRLVGEALPHYMIPSRVVVQREFPRSASGKVQRSALPDPAPAEGDGGAPPRTPTERRVAELMARAAGVSRLGATDDFFRVGGHSLAAAQLVSHARRAFGVELAIRDVFADRTVSALAARIDALAGAGPAAEQDDVPLVRLPRGTRAVVPDPGSEAR